MEIPQAPQPPQIPPSYGGPIAHQRPLGLTNYSPTAIYILFVATLGIFQIYWFYKLWDAFKGDTQSKTASFFKALFALFFARGLFQEILDESQAMGYQEKNTAMTLYLAWAVLLILTNLLFFPIFLLPLPLIAIQKAVNYQLSIRG